MRILPLFIVLCATLVASAPAAGASEETRPTWTVEYLVALGINADSRLRIQQAGYPDIALDAQWSSRPFHTPYLWMLRAGREGRRHGWALELHHHKLFLQNKPPEVQDFNITHGTNFLTAQHSWLRHRWRWFALAGAVIAHPEGTVRGMPFEEKSGFLGTGYSLTGPVLGGGVGASLPVTSWLHVSGEARVTHAWIRAKATDGHVQVRNLAFHLPIGAKLRF